jgi:hypothetical protein
MSQIYFTNKSNPTPKMLKMNVDEVFFDALGRGYAVGAVSERDMSNPIDVFQKPQGLPEQVALASISNIYLADGFDKLQGILMRAEDNLPDNIKNAQGLLDFDKAIVDLKKAMNMHQIAEMSQKRNIIENGRAPAIFKVIHLDRQRVGWNYQDQSLGMGEQVHFDHGAGVQRNTDAEFIWTTPVLTNQLEALTLKKQVSRFNGIITPKDGEPFYGNVQYSENDEGLYVNGKRAEPGDITCVTPLPKENANVWKSCSTKPENGQLVMGWDNDKVREGYSGPYFDVKTFDSSNKNNKRFQNYGGAMLGGTPWAGYKSWQSVETLANDTMGKGFSDLVVDLLTKIQLEVDALTNVGNKPKISV